MHSFSRIQGHVVARKLPPLRLPATQPFLTGVDPADHGVYDILETVPGTHKQYRVTYRSIKEWTFVGVDLRRGPLGGGQEGRLRGALAAG